MKQETTASESQPTEHATSERRNGLAVKFVKLEPLSYGHVVQLGLALAVAMASLRLAAVARGDMGLAVTVLKASGYVAPIVEMALSFFPALLMLSSVYVLQYRWSATEAGRHDVLSRQAWLIVLWLFVFMIFLADWSTLAAATVLIVLTGLMDRGFRRRSRHGGKEVPPDEYMRIRRREIFAVAVPVIAMTFLPSVTDPEPWLPQEAIITESETIRGYVLSVGDPWVTVLVDEPRYLRYVPLDDIEARNMCPAGSRRTLVDLLPPRRESPPKCAEAQPKP